MSGEIDNLALVPLHPGCVNKKEPEVKAFPIVLGRTNLANWWWNSCPCEKYCRLHCKPVAQNIRSLSKTMLMVDSKAKMNAVGKNSHLITVIPERADNVLKQNDIVCVGRRDREPWMRFQVVPASAGASNRRQSRRRESRRRHSADGHTFVIDNAKSNTPPEWITTTRKSRMSSSSTPPIPPNALTQQNAPNPEPQKRRRKRSRESSFLLSSRVFDEINPNAKADKRLLSGQNKSAYGHLVVQDYEKSARVLESDRAKRRETSEFVESQGGRLYGGRMPFLLKRSGKDSGPFEEALELPQVTIPPEAVQPLAVVTEAVVRVLDASKEESQDVPAGVVYRTQLDEKLADEHLDQPEESEIDEELNEGQPDSILVWSASNQTDKSEKAINSLPPTVEPSQRDDPTASARGGVESSSMNMPTAGSTHERSNHQMSLSANYAESSIINMPAVGSTLEETNHHTHTTTSPATARSPNRTVQSSDAELQYWEQIAEGEPGKVSAFRSALANLIVVKNRGKGQGDPMWLPDLLDDSAA